jgi:5'-methylthioadenosine phosphorylase
VIGLISGTGTEQWPALADKRSEARPTRWGAVELTRGRIGGVEVAHVSRHGSVHERLSNHVEHRANLAALKDLGVKAVLSLTVCGAVDATVPLSSAVVFDDLYFPSNRLPDGSLCTVFDSPGRRGRGHWIFDQPFCEPMRRTLLQAGRELGLSLSASGAYGHVDGPRFNSRTEVAALRDIGVVAVSQTGGSEAVLAGELELSFALVGFVTDYANGVVAEPQTVEDLLARVAESTKVFTSLVERALPAIEDLELSVPGVVYRFDR